MGSEGHGEPEESEAYTGNDTRAGRGICRTMMLIFAILESMFALIFAIDYDIIYLIKPLKGDWNEKILDGEA